MNWLCIQTIAKLSPFKMYFFISQSDLIWIHKVKQYSNVAWISLSLSVCGGGGGEGVQHASHLTRAVFIFMVYTYFLSDFSSFPVSSLCISFLCTWLFFYWLNMFFSILCSIAIWISTWVPPTFRGPSILLLLIRLCNLLQWWIKRGAQQARAPQFWLTMIFCIPLCIRML